MKQEIIDLQNTAIKSLLSLAKSRKKEISLKAPTGSGKTYIMASFMNSMLGNDKNVIFVVSTPSKGELARQNYDTFAQLSLNTFTNINPSYISSGKENNKNEDYSLFIDISHNVYVLPTAQYTDSTRIKKEQTLRQFLEKCTSLHKRVILIRDESHIATNKLNELNKYFDQTINFSATPKEDIYDICIREDSAIRSNLIKSVEYKDNAGDLKISLENALDKFKKDIRPIYQQQGINPAFIIQISNKEKAEEEIKIIKEVLKDKDLQWVCFVEKESQYESNTKLEKLKNKSLWKNYVKKNDSFIDVVIFKMVITEGFDMPRACMLYQVRNSKSKQLDEQVIGRVRRNPCLTNFEDLDKETQDVMSKAIVYGIKPKENTKKVATRLKGLQIEDNIETALFQNEIINEFAPFHITMLQEVTPDDIDITDCIDKTKIQFLGDSVFDLYRDIESSNDLVKEKLKQYCSNYEKWFEYAANLAAIKNKVKEVVNNYDKYGYVKEVKLRTNTYSFFYETDNKERIKNWMWSGEKDSNFSFDSEAEYEWFTILDDLADDYCKRIEIDNKQVYLFGKNFIENSNIKFDYFNVRKCTSYPDFIFKDKADNIHIFEVKSLNKTGNNNIDEQEYNQKILSLQQAYSFASKKTGYIFYVPIKVNDGWKIWRAKNGEIDDIITKEMFIEYMKKMATSKRG